jgi:tetrahydromethanopterin S-methyltransferase subunit G
MLMAVMMSPRERWTDERLDDLKGRVDQGFSEIKVEVRDGFKRMEAQLDKRFEEVDKRFDVVDKRLVRLEDAYFSLNRTMWTGTCMIIAGLIGTGVFG